MSNLPTGRETIVLDNGASMMKVGRARDVSTLNSASSTNACRLIPNFIAKARSERRRPFVGSQIDDCRDTSGMFFILPFQKGYMTTPDVQKTIWDYLFGPECLRVTPNESNILVTEPMMNFVSCQEVMCELLFEEYDFHAVARTTAPHMADYKYAIDHPSNALCTLVVDSGYSFTHIVPFINGQKIIEGIRRIDCGGKALTNHLKEIISYRQLHVLDETYLMNQVKEDLCFVSADLKADMEIARRKGAENTILREYVLPDYSTIRKGFVRPEAEIGTKPTNNEQLLRMNNERFTVPELLFYPSDVGINQMGISEAIVQVIHGFPEAMQPHFCKNIVLIGGNAKIPGFRERILSDVRQNMCSYYDVKVFCDANPVTYPWFAANKFASDPEFPKYLVTKSKYLEYGLTAFRTKSNI